MRLTSLPVICGVTLKGVRCAHAESRQHIGYVQDMDLTLGADAWPQRTLPVGARTIKTLPGHAFTHRELSAAMGPISLTTNSIHDGFGWCALFIYVLFRASLVVQWQQVTRKEDR